MLDTKFINLAAPLVSISGLKTHGFSVQLSNIGSIATELVT